jgi:hypothetical protein
LSAAKEAPFVEQMDPILEARRNAMSELASLLFEQAEEALPMTNITRKGLAALTRGAGGALGTADRTRIMLHLGQAIESQSQG